MQALAFVEPEVSMKEEIKKALTECLASQDIRETYVKLFNECSMTAEGMKTCKETLFELLQKGYITSLECFRRISDVIKEMN